MSIFLVAKLTICYAKSVIYAMSLDIIGEATIIIAELDSVEVH